VDSRSKSSDGTGQLTSDSASSLSGPQARLDEATLQLLDGTYPELSLDEFAAVLANHLRRQWLEGQRLPAEMLLDRFPQVSADAQRAVDIIYMEYLVREQLGEKPAAREFATRFPHLEGLLLEQIDLHEALRPEDIAAENGEKRTYELRDGDGEPKSQQFPVIPSLQIVRELGRGGMAVVYLARQPDLNRLVALKMVRAIDGGNRQLVDRFRTEAETVARLHHPRIVQIYSYGEQDGLPYLVLEYVDGGTLAQHLDGTPWSPAHAAALIAQLARTVHFAHEQGVVHRDLKPANVLLKDDRRGSDVKIADFGLAKILRDDPSTATHTGSLLGTPNYMAPEQAVGDSRGISPATDVYALGAMLYELLTGRPPFKAETAVKTLRQLAAGEPPVSIYRLSPDVPRDLATICEKCLHREASHRYGSAQELADDLGRFLTDRPIHARRTPALVQGWQWCRRNRPLATALGTVIGLLLAIAVVAVGYSVRLSDQLRKTEAAQKAQREANAVAQLRLWDAYLAEAAARNVSRQPGQRFVALERVGKAIDLLDKIGRTSERVATVRDATLASLALSDLRKVRNLDEVPHDSRPMSISTGGGRFVVQSAAGDWEVYDLNTGRLILRLPLVTGAHAVISPTGQHLAIVEPSATSILRIDSQEKVIGDLPKADHVAFSSDGKLFALGHARGVSLLDTQTGKVLHELGSTKADSQIRFDWDGDRLAVVRGGQLQIFSIESGEMESTFDVKISGQCCIAWHPAGGFVAVWGYDGIRLWNLETRTVALKYPHGGFPWNLEFTEDGTRLVACSMWDQRLAVWDVGQGTQVLDMRSFVSPNCSQASDGSVQLVRVVEGRVELWESSGDAECRSFGNQLFPSTGTCSRASLSPDSRLLLVSRDSGLELWDLDTLFRVASIAPGGPCQGFFTPEGDIVYASERGIYRLERKKDAESAPRTDSRSALREVRFGPSQQLAGPIFPHSFSVSSDGKRATFCDATDWYAMSLEEPEKHVTLLGEGDPRLGAVSNDGRHVVVSNWDSGGSTVWNAQTGNKLAELKSGLWGFPAFSANSKWLATTPDGVCIWNADDWRLMTRCNAVGTTPAGLGISFSPDSRALVIGQTDGLIRLVSPETGEDWATLAHPQLSCASVIAISPDQSRLVTLPLVPDSPGFVWDLAAMRNRLQLTGLNWRADVLLPSTRRRERHPLVVQLESDPKSPGPTFESYFKRARAALVEQVQDLQRKNAETPAEP